MPVQKLSKVSIDKLTFTGKPVDYYDSDLKGFGVRVGLESKTFFARKELRGRPVRVTIGKLDPWTPDQARTEAKNLLRQMDQGIDPREKERLAKEASLTLESVFTDYLQHRKLKPATKKSYGYVKDLYLTPWLKLPIDDITRAEVLKLHRKITADIGDGSANLAMTVFRSLWNYSHAHLDNPPIAPTKILSATKTWNVNKRRKDRLAPTQFPQFIEALALLREVQQDAFTLVLHTGMRSEEAARLLWSGVNLGKGSLMVKDTKNGTDLTLPVTTPIRAMLERRKELNDGSPFVFAGQGKGGNVKLQAKTLQKLGFEGLTVHGLRRTFRSLCESLAIPSATTKALMNHSLDSDITDSYLDMPIEILRPFSERISTEIIRLSSLKVAKAETAAPSIYDYAGGI